MSLLVRSVLRREPRELRRTLGFVRERAEGPDGKVMMLPVLKFSYYRLLPERKLAILNFLKTQPDCCASLEDLAERTKMSLPLVSYHVNGNSKAEGLLTMGLIETQLGQRGKTQVMLTELGRLLAEGVIEPMQATVG